MTDNKCMYRGSTIGSKPICFKGNDCVSVDYKCNIYKKKIETLIDVSDKDFKEKFNINRLINLLLTQKWMKDCVIENDDGRIVVRYPNEHDDTFLKYSKGPQQGFFWDNCGDNMYNKELAILALSKAPIPLNYRKAEYPLVFSLNSKEN